MKTYVGRRLESGQVTVTVIDEEQTTLGNRRDLDPRNDIVNHSPDGFEWGYGGSGPAQLALALLADALDDDKKALDAHQWFKNYVIADLYRDDGWVMSDTVIKVLCRKIDRVQATLQGGGGVTAY